MEQPVPDHVDLDLRNRVLRDAARQHRVKLEDLMKQDAIDESAQTHPEQRSGRHERTLIDIHFPGPPIQPR
jgi:hypothetical protein